jgi:hypothetical protein
MRRLDLSRPAAADEGVSLEFTLLFFHLFLKATIDSSLVGMLR